MSFILKTYTPAQANEKFALDCEVPVRIGVAGDTIVVVTELYDERSTNFLVEMIREGQELEQFQVNKGPRAEAIAIALLKTAAYT